MAAKYDNGVWTDMAFNLGCDARIAGEPRSTVPFSWARKPEREAWYRGWNHVNREWGKHRCPDDPAPELPSVKEGQ